MAYKGPTRELFLKNQQTDMKRAQETRNVNADTLAQLKLVTPGTAIREDKNDGNYFLLSAGAYTLTKLTVANTQVQGLGKVEITTTLEIDSPYSVISNVKFTSSGNYLVRVKNFRRAVFNGCTFEKPVGAPASDTSGDKKCFVLVEPFGFAVFNGCLFAGPRSNGLVVVNLNPLADTNVGIVGCANVTGRAHHNVTVTFEV